MDRRRKTRSIGRAGAGAARRGRSGPDAFGPPRPKSARSRTWALGGLCLLGGCHVGASGSGDVLGLLVGVGFVVLANLLYIKWRREDEPSWVRRLVAFLMGFPFTFLTYLLVEPDADLAWKRLQARMDQDDPRQVERDFRRELARVRQRRFEAAVEVPLQEEPLE